MGKSVRRLATRAAGKTPGERELSLKEIMEFLGSNVLEKQSDLIDALKKDLQEARERLAKLEEYKDPHCPVSMMKRRLHASNMDM